MLFISAGSHLVVTGCSSHTVNGCSGDIKDVLSQDVQLSHVVD